MGEWIVILWSMKIFVTGAHGQLGLQLCRLLGEEAHGTDIDTLDLTDRQAVLRTLEELRPRAVINCAAYTRVDDAEKHRDLCFGANAEAVAHLAEASTRLDIPLLQVSTDYVFGVVPRDARPWLEDDATTSQGVYAQSKLAGEQAARRNPRHFVVRSCGLYGHPARWHVGPNFVDTMLRLGRERSELQIVADQTCTPTFVRHLARAIAFLLSTEAYGTYHVTNTGAATWCEFAAAVFRLAGLSVAIQPITTEAYGAAAPRPRYSVLDTTRYHALGGPAMPCWQDALAEYLSTTSEGKPLD